METQVAVMAQIRPGKREQLAKRLAEGPPFDLAEQGITRHQAFLGDEWVVFVFEGEGVRSRVEALSRSLPMTEMARMGMLVHNPAVLAEGFDWHATSAAAGRR